MKNTETEKNHDAEKRPEVVFQNGFGSFFIFFPEIIQKSGLNRGCKRKTPVNTGVFEIMAEMERFELSRRSYRPTGVRSQTLQPLGYISIFMVFRFSPKKIGGETGIRTPEAVITAYMISNHAPSAISDISPNNVNYFTILFNSSQSFFKFY